VLAECRESDQTCPDSAKAFLRVIDAILTVPRGERAALLNREINQRIRPVDDIKQYGVRDYWATPLTTFTSGLGDCEDYAIAKYFALRQIGVPAEDLRIGVLLDHADGQHHAVAAMRESNTWLILDNRNDALYSDFETSSMTALYALDEAGIVARRAVVNNMVAARWAPNLLPSRRLSH
jgi:predicted transglutaminase-like cysteine proteinase